MTNKLIFLEFCGLIDYLLIYSLYCYCGQADVITRENGIVASAANDWTLGEAAFPLSLVFGILGVSAAGLGPWQQKVGVRKSLLCGSVAFGSGLGLAALGIHYHMLPLVYVGYGGMSVYLVFFLWISLITFCFNFLY